ncbi:hypothetical protein E4U58_006224 [Claviceps cyperi]|nr:hypothetical protein E4U58_006224 [Claviceps cyperi]
MQHLIGLDAVKASVKALIDSIQTNYQRELEEEPIVEYNPNRVFVANPGIGKTTVAKLYGQILVIVKNLSDFVGGALEQSEQQTKGILAATAGKVLVIDEAYGLIVSTVHSTPGDDRCVLLLGYFDQMEEMFRTSQLADIFRLKLEQQGFGVTETGKQVALDMMNRARNRPNFGNAGEIDILLNEAKRRHQTPGQNVITVLEAVDFDEDHDRLQSSETNIAELFAGTSGCEELSKPSKATSTRCEPCRPWASTRRRRSRSRSCFAGHPARESQPQHARWARCYMTWAFSRAVKQVPKYARCWTRPSVRCCLLVDEAYRLSEDAFAKEALDELVDAITKPKCNKRLTIILAGYGEDINRLLQVNPALSSRFPEVVDFRSLDERERFDLLVLNFASQGRSLEKGGKGVLDARCLQNPTEDVETLVEAMFQTAVKSLTFGAGPLAVVITETTVKNGTSSATGYDLSANVKPPHSALTAMVVWKPRRKPIFEPPS